MAAPPEPLSLALLQSFVPTRTLAADALAGRVSLLGAFPAHPDSPAIVHLARAALPAEPAHVLAGLVAWQPRGDNGIYAWGAAEGAAGDPGWEVSVVWPATELHVRKYETQEYALVTETPELYRTVTLPYLQALPPSRTAWVHNILAGLKEQDAVLLRDSAFVLLPDSKWDCRTVDTLYLTAIAADGGRLRSLRDLRGEDVPFLRRVKQEVGRFVEARWGVRESQLRFFIHYQPSYYHLHIHVTHVAYTSPWGGTAADRAHLLENVISLLELDSEAYAKLSLTYVLGEQHGLHGPMRAAGAV